MKALGLVVSEKNIFYVFPKTPPVRGPYTLRVYIGIHYVYTLLHTKYESSGPCGFGEDFFFHDFFIVCLWELMTPEAGPFLTPRGMVGRIYKTDHYKMLHLKCKSSGSCFFFFFFFFFFSHDAPWTGPVWTPEAWLAGFI